MGDQNLIDKSMRSVFVGNIPYEATEEKLKDIFSEVGPVLSFKLVFDRETGKPKGYGFCEYKDTETALSAMRNLNGYEIGGRTLRVDNACTEKSRLEMQTLLQSAPAESPYGEPVNAEKAPEAISKAVASMPPEQMYELMKQMKECVLNNPIEARTMLLQNPQLSYALLQGLVVMKVIDPNTAVAMLHKVNPLPVPLSGDKPMTVPLATPVTSAVATSTNPVTTSVTVPVDSWVGTLPPSGPVPPPPTRPAVTPGFLGVQDMDMRQPVDPRLRLIDQDLRIPPSAQPSLHAGFAGHTPAHPPAHAATHPAAHSVSHPTSHPAAHPAAHAAPHPVAHPAAHQSPNQTTHSATHPQQNFPPEHYPARDPRMVPAPERFPSRDPRDRVDPRTGTAPIGPVTRPPSVAPVTTPRIVPPVTAGAPPNLMAGAGASDQEKAALIMQVLQLTDEQIGMLPPDQRQSILLLKEQIAKSAQR